MDNDRQTPRGDSCCSIDDHHGARALRNLHRTIQLNAILVQPRRNAAKPINGDLQLVVARTTGGPEAGHNGVIACVWSSADTHVIRAGSRNGEHQPRIAAQTWSVVVDRQLNTRTIEQPHHRIQR